MTLRSSPCSSGGARGGSLPWGGGMWTVSVSGVGGLGGWKLLQQRRHEDTSGSGLDLRTQESRKSLCFGLQHSALETASSLSFPTGQAHVHGSTQFLHL